MKEEAQTLFKEELARIRSDWQFYKRHTEIIAIYTVLYVVITWLFWSSVTRLWIELVAIFVFVVALTYAISLLTIFYCSKVQYGDEDSTQNKIHTFLNFDLERLLRIAKLNGIIVRACRELSLLSFSTLRQQADRSKSK